MPYADPDRRRAVQREAQRRRRDRRRAAGLPVNPVNPPVSFNPRPPVLLSDDGASGGLPERPPVASATDVLSVLGESIEEVRTDPFLGSAARARVLSQLAGVALRAIEVDGNERLGVLEARLDELAAPALKAVS